jgi:COP9 signalosome complex subunit 2
LPQPHSYSTIACLENLANIRRYGFDFEDDDEEETGNVDIENKYYNAKQMKADNPAEAIDEFLELPVLEEEKGDWGFKGLKQAIKLEYRLGRYEKVTLTVYKR